MNRAFSKILILVIIVLFAGGGIFAWQYFGGREETGPGDKETKIENDTAVITEDIAKWNIYQNKKYGYEIKYPSELKVIESEYTPIERTEIMMWEFSSVRSNVSASISVSVGPKSGGYLLSELIYDRNFCETEEDDLSAKIYCETNYRLLPVAGAAYQKDGNAFIVLLLVQGPENLTKTDLAEEINIYEEMLSTFKFIQVKQTSTETEVKPAEKKLIDEIPTSLMPLGRNDQTRLLRVKMTGAALRVYFGDYQKDPTTLPEVQYLISGDNADDILKDPETKEFFEYSSLLGGSDYRFCVEYDAMGQECYNSKDF